MIGEKMVSLRKWLDRTTKTLTTIASGIAFFFITAMAVLGTTDMIMMNFFGQALLGAVELASVCLSATAFLGLPLAQKVSRHIAVDIVTSRVSEARQRFFLIFSSVLSFMFLSLLSVQMWKLFAASFQIGELDSGPLAFPLYVFKGLAFFGVVAGALEAGRQIVELASTNLISEGN